MTLLHPTTPLARCRHPLLLLLLLFPQIACAQDSVKVTDGFRQFDEWTTRKYLATGLVGGILGVSMVWSYDSWWRDNARSFHFQSENWLNGPHRGIDKAGHLYTSYFYFHTLRNVMLWGGYRPSLANWVGVGGAAFFALAVEIGDGLSDIGFDYQDVVFNFAGIGFAYLQTEVPALSHFGLKWTYIPPEGFDFPPRFTRHYDGHTYWLTADVHNLLPESMRGCWPAFLNLGVGFSVADNMTRRELVFGLDLNLGAIGSPGEDVLLLRNTLDMFHYPAPAVKWTEGRAPKAYLFQLN
jgi:hypothetical protein